MKEILTAIGLMSGTSMDGVDVALLETDGVHIHEFGPTMFCPYSPEQRTLLREAIDRAKQIKDREDRSGVLGIAEMEVTKAHIRAIRKFCREKNVSTQMVDVVGFHGQTVLHAPERALTVQLGAGVQVYEAFGIPTVCDMRADDVAMGGQGAPLVPVYHKALADYSDLRLPAVIVNIGGVANITWIGENGRLVAFDTGPGNALLDDWVSFHVGQPMDEGGEYASAGRVSMMHLDKMLDHPFFDVKPPKSLDREDFSFKTVEKLSLIDGAATLTAFTAQSLALSMMHMPKQPVTWVVTGGGAQNPVLCDMVEEAVLTHGSGADVDFIAAEDLDWKPDFIEAQAFAFMAVRSVKHLPITYPDTTGVAEPSEGGVLIGSHLI